MCNGLCVRFKRKRKEKNYYCQKCAKFIPKSCLKREEKDNGRLRCSCCNGLVRNKTRVYLTT